MRYIDLCFPVNQDTIRTLPMNEKTDNYPISELSAVMPAYNEEAVLPLVLNESLEVLQQLCRQWELIIVDDGSTDSTPAILEEWSRREPHLRVVTLRPNHGYTRALAKGFAAARHEAIFYTDADAQFDLKEVVNLYPHLAEADMVAGYRVHRKDPWIRLVTSAVYNLMQDMILGTQVKDVNCAFKLFRASFFDKVHIQSDGFLIDAELYARAKRAGLTWVQVGVTHRLRERGSSTVRVSTITQTLRELWRLRAMLREER